MQAVIPALTKGRLCVILIGVTATTFAECSSRDIGAVGPGADMGGRR
jgi:hypothetical protein